MDKGGSWMFEIMGFIIGLIICAYFITLEIVD